MADLSAAPALNGWPAPAPRGRVITCYGMLPNMEHLAFPRWLAGLAGPEDVLLLSANLYRQHGRGGGAGVSGEDAAPILAQYDNPPARRWYAGCLAELGLDAADYRLSVEARSLPGAGGGPLPGAWRVWVEAEVTRRRPLIWRDEGPPITLEPGTRLAVFHSNRFTPDAAGALLRDAGLRLLERWVHPGGEEGIFSCRGDALP